MFTQHSFEADRPTGTSSIRGRKATTGARRPAVTSDMASAVPPLHWWRRLPADAFTFEHFAVLRRAVSGIGMVGEPRWADAVRGHPAAAVAAAQRIIGERRPLLPIVDLTMSTVLIAALVACDPAALAVLVTMIDRIADATEKDALRRSWLGRVNLHVHDRIGTSAAFARIGTGD